ncbi:hypothetical protein LIP68_15100, partial [Anaerostipes hadrus]|nr:hypothetical protein [Anaerostipes hadrus]
LINLISVFCVYTKLETVSHFPKILSFLYNPNIKKADNPCVHYTEVISLISGFESLRGRTSFPFSFVKIAYFLFCVNFVIYSNISFTSDSSILHFSAICAIVQPFCDN